MSGSTYSAFVGERRLLTAPLPELLRALKEHRLERGASVLVFEDETGRQVDFNLRGTLEDVLARYVPSAPRRPGRPKLGVTAREVTLLPRHWEWLDQQRGGASATLRRLVEEARKRDPRKQEAARAAEAAGNFMTAIAGNQPGFEEATRALYAGQRERFIQLTRRWPEDIRDHALRLAHAAFGDEP